MARVNLDKLLSDLQAAGIPLATLRSKTGYLDGIDIDYLPSATAAQRQTAARIIAAYGFVYRTSKPVMALTITPLWQQRPISLWGAL